MKKLFVSALAGLLTLFSSRGDSLPDRIPIGNQIFDSLVSLGPCHVTVSLQSTNSSRGIDSCGSIQKDLQFGSFGEFQSYVALRASKLFNLTGASARHADIRMKVFLTYNLTNLLKADLNLGPGNTLGNTLFIIPPAFYKITFAPVTGISSATIVNDFESISLDCSGNPYILSSILATNSGRLRINLVSADGTSRTYTEFGQYIEQPKIRIFWMPAEVAYSYEYDQYWGDGYPAHNSYNLMVESTLGSDLIIQSSENLEDWQIFRHIPWTPFSESVFTIPIDTNSAAKFFRAYAQ